MAEVTPVPIFRGVGSVLTAAAPVQTHKNDVFAFLHGSGYVHRPWDVAVVESTNFVAVPTKGTLIPGWLLVVPRSYSLCYGALARELIDEYRMFRQRVTDLVADAFGPPTCFEHGPIATSQQSGCGVDYAHLHVVPLQFDLRTAIDAEVSDRLDWVSCDPVIGPIDFHEKNLEYTVVQTPDNHTEIATHLSFPSQLARKAIARHLGLATQYDWRLHLMEDNAWKTLNTLGHEFAN